MQRVAHGLSRFSGFLSLFCAVAYLLTYFGQNLPAALTGLSFCLLFPLLGFLILYGNRHGVKQIYNYVATRHHWILTAIFLLVGLNFLWNFQQLEGGSPDREDGRYILSNHGTFVRELTESEYREMRVAELRLMSGHPIFFFTLAAFGWKGVAQTLESKVSDSKIA